MGSQTTTESCRLSGLAQSTSRAHRRASDIVPTLNTYLSLRGDLPCGGWKLSSLAATGALADGGGRGRWSPLVPRRPGRGGGCEAVSLTLLAGPQ